MRRGLTGKGIAMRGRRAERGQTILLVAVSIVALLSMAALAIDVVTLYVAKSEIQRAADAAALVGAKAVADSGVTTLANTDTDLAGAETLATNMATNAITAMLSASTANANLVSGQVPQLVTGYPKVDFTTHGNNNPVVTVVLQQLNLPTFFARIFAQTSAMTGATAVAEAYNPANMQPEFTPITPQCVKPWLMGNGDPTRGTQNNNPMPALVDPTTGLVESNVDTLIGASFYVTSICSSGGGPSCQPSGTLDYQAGNPNATPPYPAVYYAPAVVAPTTLYSPACAGSLPDTYAQDVAGCDATPYSWTQCGGTTNNLLYDPTENPAQNTQGKTGTDANSDTAQGAECLLGFNPPGYTGPGLGQDEINYPATWPTGGAPQIMVKSGAQAGNVVSTSNSIVTIPIIQTVDLTKTRDVTVVGFLQAFINYVGYDTGTGSNNQNYGDINITVMNVVGCGPTTNGNPAVVGGNGVSTIPVRLITPP